MGFYHFIGQVFDPYEVFNTGQSWEYEEAFINYIKRYLYMHEYQKIYAWVSYLIQISCMQCFVVFVYNISLCIIWSTAALHDVQLIYSILILIKYMHKISTSYSCFWVKITTCFSYFSMHAVIKVELSCIYIDSWLDKIINIQLVNANPLFIDL